MWKETAVAFMNVLTQHLHKFDEENQAIVTADLEPRVEVGVFWVRWKTVTELTHMLSTNYW